MAVTFALLGFAEWQLGRRRTIAVTLGGQVAAAVAAIQFLELCRHSGRTWAGRTAGRLDVTFSGGTLAAIAVAGATPQAPWRLRVRAALCGYAAVAIVYVGTLADLAHFFPLVPALPLGQRAGPGPARIEAERARVAVAGFRRAAAARRRRRRDVVRSERRPPGHDRRAFPVHHRNPRPVRSCCRCSTGWAAARAWRGGGPWGCVRSPRHRCSCGRSGSRRRAGGHRLRRSRAPGVRRGQSLVDGRARPARGGAPGVPGALAPCGCGCCRTAVRTVRTRATCWNATEAREDDVEFRLVRLVEQPAAIREQIRALSEE